MSSFQFYEKALFGTTTPKVYKSSIPTNKFTSNSNITQTNLGHRAEPLKADNSTFKIVVILDESGSMEDIRENMIKSINDLIKEQKQVTEGKPTTLTLVKFNNIIKRVIEDKPLNEVQYLTSNDYRPNGSTALYDCIGDTIQRFRNQKDVLMVIVTDGQENASRDYNNREITKMIEDKKKYDGWSYVYLSSDIGTFSQGNSMGLNESFNCTNKIINKSNFGYYVSKNLNDAIKQQRSCGLSVNAQLN